MNTPDIKHNPHPKMRYEITIMIQDAPGAFESVNGSVQYRVKNDDCVPLQPVSGARLVPEEDVHVTFHRVSEHEYKGTIYLDLLQDEDYYGLGVCHWGLVNVAAELKAGKMIFTPYIGVDQIIAQRPSVQYFLKSNYSGDASKEGAALPRIPGTPAAEYVEQHPDKRFLITIAAKESFE
ncbi:hypothetical protein [Dyella sp. OK004]|uniref:hypothetical protein n=1 Tax=Dyella sp. OK004 TaxID=1855292 RepID=UPI000B839B00|nr:hypothetical protein [Dyella sp. OK004]